MNEKILLIGANSEIGQAIAYGVSEKLDTKRKIAVVRNLNSGISAERIVVVEKYSDIDLDTILETEKIVAIIISFGVMSHAETFLESLKEDLEVNVVEYLSVVRKCLTFMLQNESIELHITSSILADFSRRSILSYSLSKSIMEVSLIRMIEDFERSKANVYIWKPAFVRTPLNLNRKTSFVSTSLSSISKKVEKTKNSGQHYIPGITFIPSKFLRSFPAISRFLK